MIFFHFFTQMSITLNYKKGKLIVKTTQRIKELEHYLKTDMFTFMEKSHVFYSIHFVDEVWGYNVETYWVFKWLQVLKKVLSISKYDYESIKCCMENYEVIPLRIQMLTWKRTEITQYHLNPGFAATSSDILFTYN